MIPKCYTLINKMYDPKKNIRMVQKKIREWVSKLDDISNDKQYNQIFEKMNPQFLSYNNTKKNIIIFIIFIFIFIFIYKIQ